MLNKKRVEETAEVKAPKKSRQTIKNTIALKRNVYAIGLSVIFIVAVVLINVFSTVMAERYPLDLDLTSDKKHSMTDDNVSFIKSVEKPVNIYVCLTEDDYSCESSSSYNMSYFAAQQYFVDYNSENASYFVQTVELMKKYAMYNDNITLTFLDMNEPTSAITTANFDDLEYSTGDILVESISTDADGKESARRTALLFEDIYTLQGSTMTESYKQYQMIYGNLALYGQGVGYAITENNIEKALSAAIYKVISDSTPKYLVPTTYYPVVNNSAIIIDEYLKETLTINNYELDYVEGMIANVLTKENFDEYEGIILAGCEKDISPADYEVIVNFLDNGGKRGKSLFYFAGVDVKNKMPQMSSLLADWGIGFEDGIVYESSTSNRVVQEEKGDPTEFLHVATGSEFTINANEKGFFAVGNTVPMTVLYPKNVTATHIRSTEVLMRTGGYGTTTIMPLGEDATTWKPESGAKYDAYPTIILSKDEMSQEDHSIATSYVVAFASTEFIANEWVDNYSAVANDHFVLDIFNSASGMTENPFNFAAKTITNEKFVTKESNQLTVKIIFMAVIPVLIMATGITVWIVRKRK